MHGFAPRRRERARAEPSPQPGRIAPPAVDTELAGLHHLFRCAVAGPDLGQAAHGGLDDERDLAAGETLRVDTGCLVAFEPKVSYDIQMVKGVKTFLFGGEGLCFAAVTGPGRVGLHTLSFARLSARVVQASGLLRGGRREEGSILGPLGNLLDGDG